MAGFLTKPTLAQLPDFTQTDCNGVTHHLYDDLAAGNAVVLKFCAGWCAPCSITNPLYENLWEEVRAGCNLKMYSMLFETGITGQPTDCNYGTTYANHYGLTMPVLTNIGVWGSGVTAQYASMYNMDAIPTTFIIVPNPQDPANSNVKWIVGAYENLGQMIKDSLALGGFNVASLTLAGELCTNTPSATLTSSSPTGNLWSTGETSQTITIHQSGVYTLTLSSNGCTTTAKQPVEFNPLPSAGTASTSNANMCQDGFIYLNYDLPQGSPDNVMWLWKTSFDTEWQEVGLATAGPVPFFIYQLPGTQLQFMVRVANNNGLCPVFSNQVNVTVTNSSSTVTPGTASSSSTTVCPGNGFTLYYSGGVPGSVWEIYDPTDGVWYPVAYADQPMNPAGITPLMRGGNNDLFRVKSPNGDCYTLSNTVQINYFQLVPLSITGPTFTCGDASVKLKLNGSYSNIHWSTGATTATISVNPAATTLYSVSAVDAHGCTLQKSHTLAVWKQVSPIINASSPGVVCKGTPVTLSFGGTNSGTPCTISTFGQYPEGSFSVSTCGGMPETITDQGYLGEYSLVNVESGKYYYFASTNPGVVDVINTITNAGGTEVHASGSLRAIWKATYTGQVRFYTHGSGCSASDEVLLTRSVACYTDPSSLGSFLWMPGGLTTPAITVSPGSTSTYKLTFTEANYGCPATTSMQVIVGIDAVGANTTNITCNSATLNWTSQFDPTRWELQYRSTASGANWINAPIPDPSTRSVNITGLTTNQDYKWQIRFYCGTTRSPYTDMSLFKTLANCSTSSALRSTMTATNPEKVVTEVAGELKVTAMPNPSNTNFRIAIQSSDLNEPIKIIVADIVGRVMETRITRAGQTITIGDKYKSGTYVVQIIQGKEIRQTKLFKLSN